MPSDLQNAPQSLSPRGKKSIQDELQKAAGKTGDALHFGLVEQLEAENQMLKDQLGSGQPNENSMLANSEEKLRIVQL